MAKKKKKRWVSYGLELKISAVKRVAAGERPGDVAHDLAIDRATLYRWRQQYAELGAAGRRRVVSRDELPSPAEISARRIAELERKVGQQELELDFLRGAFERVKSLHQTRSGSGVDASIEKSKGCSWKASCK